MPAAGEPEEVEGPKEAELAAGGPDKLGGLGEPTSAARGLEKAELAIRGPEEPRGLGEPTTALLLSLSDCWQAFALTASFFRRCFFFFNYLVFS